MLSSAAGRAAPANTQKLSKNHVCTYRGCEKVFDRPSFLEKHARVHTGESIANAIIVRQAVAFFTCARDGRWRLRAPQTVREDSDSRNFRRTEVQKIDHMEVVLAEDPRGQW